ncbi:MAG: hypothetical protein QHC90_26405 [Shinella sp.]|nr:hypothetical protein [Shinella sp.]
MFAMRFFTIPVTSLSVLALLAMPGISAAQTADAGESESTNVAFATPAQRLDTLFSELKREENPEAARRISDRIRTEWQDSGSATVNLLIQWSDKAVAENRNASALDFLDEAILLKPDYAEAWNRRATLHFKMGNYRKSMSDINQVLTLEPRHFGAIAGMAAILAASGRDQMAMEAWQRFLDIYPSERQAQQQLGELAEKLAGSRT